ncbi:MAG: D-tyrosyl-tRNA(Tyr) deacylase [Chlamydiae bacterium]|nr:D-tyrosyl-tRNA(Tyr) deacylase [Chlamydiota bacterium]
MRIVIQRVLEASVTIDQKIVGQIKQGALVLFGVHKSDEEKDTLYLVDKLLNLRMFKDENDKMNLSLKDIKGSVLVVSQFTLYADCLSGRRPSFTETAEPLVAKRIYDKFVLELKSEIEVQTGVFGARMQVSLINDGPVTFIIDGKKI